MPKLTPEETKAEEARMLEEVVAGDQMCEEAPMVFTWLLTIASILLVIITAPFSLFCALKVVQETVLSLLVDTKSGAGFGTGLDVYLRTTSRRGRDGLMSSLSGAEPGMPEATHIGRWLRLQTVPAASNLTLTRINTELQAKHSVDLLHLGSL